MKIKRFRAANEHQAYARVRQELGANATVLRTRRLRPRGLLSFLRPPEVEVTAILDEEHSELVETCLRGLRRFAADRGGAASPAVQDLVPDASQILLSLAARAPRDGMVLGEGTPLAEVRRRLLGQGLAAERVEALVAGVAADLSANALGDRDAIGDTLRRQLRRHVLLLPPSRLWSTAGAVALIGPTGVGKTTTLAKLAAELSLVRQRPVKLVSADTFRVGGAAQLRAYAEILGVDFSVAYSPAELAAVVAAARDEMVLIDTPGRSPRDPASLEALGDYLRAVPDGRVLLALNAGASPGVLSDTSEQFALAPIAGVVLTKLDEAAQIGAAVEQVMARGLPLAYLTTGQNVPDDIEPAGVEALLRRLLEGM